MSDPLQQILERVTELVGLSPDQRLAIEHELRGDWGGERAYIARLGECGARLQAQRDIRIRQQHRAGESVKFLARRWELSERRIRQIVSG